MLKYVNTSIVFQEIPDEVTLSVNISNCPCRCPNCHSRFLWDDIGTPLTTDELNRLVLEYNREITCICFMGGDAAPEQINQLAQYIRHNHPNLKVGWYSGRIRISSAIDKSAFDYIKIGPYIKHLGGLKERTTNQRMYKKTMDGGFSDITDRFWKKL